jgi:hypothetical protein
VKVRSWFKLIQNVTRLWTRVNTLGWMMADDFSARYQFRKNGPVPRSWYRLMIHAD